MSINILKTNSVENNYVNILTYGHAGSGKTVLASTCASPLILSAEGGLLSINDFEIDYAEIGSYSSLVEAYKFVSRSEEAKKYKTIVLDSLSEIAECLLDEEKKKHKDGRQAYMAVQDMMYRMIRKFRDLPFHTYMTAKVERCQDDTQRMFYMPSMPGNKLSQNLEYFFDGLFAAKTDALMKEDEAKKARMLQTSSMHGWLAKDRSGKLDLYEEPNLGAIIEKINTTRSAQQL